MTECACGCGRAVAAYRKPSRTGPRFVRGHSTRVVAGHHGIYRPADVRFWEKIDKSGECWVWTTRNVDRFGYGRFYVHGQGPVLAHRWSYEAAYGPVPVGIRVLHRCDNPPCVRPDHLFLGTDSDNVEDMDKKGRRNRTRTINAADAAEIRRLYDASQRNGGELARRFGITRTYLWKVATGRVWQ
jgi:hypothetical protein